MAATARPVVPPTYRPRREPAWLVELRAEWDDRLAAAEDGVAIGAYPPAYLEKLRAQAAWELEHPERSGILAGGREVTRAELHAHRLPVRLVVPRACRAARPREGRPRAGRRRRACTSTSLGGTDPPSPSPSLTPRPPGCAGHFGVEGS
jgi:hypothetical protein